MTISEKLYSCKRCGHESRQKTNHFGETYSWGRVNACEKCPPWAKYPEFGGLTTWICMEKEKIEVPSPEEKRVAMENPTVADWEGYFPPPPVCTTKWNTYDWIKWVDGHGKWKKKENKA